MTMVMLVVKSCPDCHGDLDAHTWEEPALLRHAGYGETTRTVLRRCGACGWQLIAERQAVRP